MEIEIFAHAAHRSESDVWVSMLSIINTKHSPHTQRKCLNCSKILTWSLLMMDIGRYRFSSHRYSICVVWDKQQNYRETHWTQFVLSGFWHLFWFHLGHQLQVLWCCLFSTSPHFFIAARCCWITNLNIISNLFACTWYVCDFHILSKVWYSSTQEK